MGEVVHVPSISASPPRAEGGRDLLGGEASKPSLRVTTLGALWQERVREPHGRPPEDFPLELDYGHRAIELAKNMIQEAILRDWLRTQVDIRSLDNGMFCADWWRGVSGSITVDSFIGLWATPPVLCRVLGHPPRDDDTDTRSLQLLL